MTRLAQFNGAGTAFDWPEAIGHGRQPFASFPAGSWQCAAGPNGAAAGCFGWIDPDSHIVSNAFITGAFMGFVLPLSNPYNLWERAFIQYPVDGVPPFPQMIIRPGVACVVASMGTFRAKFPNGGGVGSQVYADPATGIPYAVEQVGFIPTRWTLIQSGGPGARILMSQMVQPFN